MATTTGSALKGNVFSEANEALYDPYSGFNYASSEFLTDIPWPEWNDADLNHEIWEDKMKTSPKSLFEDSNPPMVPIAIKDNVFSWKRPFQLFPEESLTVYNPNNSKFELSLPSSNGKCELFQSFNELVTILQIYASKYSFPVELETSNFIPNTQGEVWRPWHHIYSCCKAGKGQVHRPLHNPFGKYVLRLFYMGAWRKFVIDDRIPCDFFGRCMLPVTQSQGELWPILLAKGFLKIASLTPSDSLLDFPILTFLTGWINQTIMTGSKSNDQIWRRLLCLTPHYEYQDEELEVKTLPTSVKGSSKMASSKGPDKLEPQTKHFCFLLANLKGFSENPDFLYSHQIGITMNRDVPLVRCDKREPTKPWKRIRWIYWASAKGIWSDENQLPPYRRIRYITCVKELNSLLALDPKLEELFFEISDVGDADSQFQGDVSIYEIEEWSDFYKLQTYMFSMNVLFKPSCLCSNFKVTCLGSNALNKIPESSGGGKTASKTAPPSSPLHTVFFQPITMLPTQNEPCLLFCESLCGISLIMSLWVYPRTKSKFFGYLDSEQPVVFKVGQASLVIERSDWTRVEQGEILGIIKSVGNSSVWLNLCPGRHVLKLWLKAKCPYVLNIYSNVEVVVHKGPRTRFLMSTESERILQYIGNVSNAFIALTQKFGKPDLRLALRDFYEAIKPKNDKDVDYRRKVDDFIETFLLCLLLSCKNLASSTDEFRIMMDALQSLFINPKICCDLPKGEASVSLYGGSAKKGNKKVVVLKERTLSQILSYPWLPEEIEKIILIQRTFRGYRVRLLWKFQTPARKEFKFFTDKLKKICDIIFSPAKREFEVGKLIRQVAMMNPQLCTAYRFHKDFSKVIQVEEYTGRIGNVEPFAWIPFARFIIACHSSEPVPYALYFSSNLWNFVVQGVDNDTGEELFRVSNSVMPHYYQSNMTGYTILIYGWNEATVKSVNWRLQMVKMRHFQLIHICNTMLGLPCHPYSIPSLDVLEIKNFYVPNHRSRVCRCFIKIQKRTLLTVRLFTSYSRVQFYVTMYSNPKLNFPESEASSSPVIIAAANSTNGSVLIPSVVLDHFEANNSWGEYNSEEEPTVYVLEAFVVNHSWPLTKHEWGVVEPFRVNGESWKDSLMSLTSKKGPPESKKKLTRMSKRSLNEQKVVENPFWSLQVLSDSSESADPGDHVVVEEDKTYAEAVKTMKVSWEERSPGRRKKGRELRYNFLHESYLELVKNGGKEEERGGEEGKKDESERGTMSNSEENFKSSLDLMSNFSYLTNDKSCVRCLKSPRILPKVPMFELLRRYVKFTGLEPEADIDSNEYYMSKATLLRDNSTLEVESEKQVTSIPTKLSPRVFVNEMNYYRNVIVDYLAEEQKLSNQLVGESYERRLKAIERLAR